MLGYSIITVRSFSPCSRTTAALPRASMRPPKGVTAAAASLKYAPSFSGAGMGRYATTALAFGIFYSSLIVFLLGGAAGHGGRLTPRCLDRAFEREIARIREPRPLVVAVTGLRPERRNFPRSTFQFAVD